jgi:hypothetical protein
VSSNDPYDQQGEPSEEEVRQYLAQMRATPVDQVVAEVVQGLLNAVQVKLGRGDARLLIDMASAIADLGRGRLDGQLQAQVDQALTQLRLAQVEAEREVATAGHQEPNDVSATDTTPAGDDAPPAGSTPTPPPPQGSRLWVPGR